MKKRTEGIQKREKELKNMKEKRKCKHEGEKEKVGKRMRKKEECTK